MMCDQWSGQPGRTQIKICGVRDPEMANIAIDAGANAIGMVSHPASPRHIDQDTIDRIRKIVPSDIPAIEVLVNPPEQTLRRSSGWIQLHGDESEKTASIATGPVIRGFSFSPEAVRRWNDCDDVSILLIDGPGKGAGETFDHGQLLALKDTMDKPMIQTQRDDLIVKDVTGNMLNAADDFHAVDDERMQRRNTQSRALFNRLTV